MVGRQRSGTGAERHARAGGLFQRLYTRARLGRLEVPQASWELPLLELGLRSVLAYNDDDDDDDDSMSDEPDPAFPTLDDLVLRGADLFFNETFNGNGRTCGTCHPAQNNFTIDPEYIATLPDSDPLFVAEFLPALAENFEKPALMRGVGLILHNTNGFGDLANNFTMRGVPHTLGLPTSLTPSPGDGTTTPLVQRTGWSGDGSPGDGSLRNFANGAITQSFPLTTNRIPGIDFRLPTDAELDALEAFQLFLGRDADIDVGAINFKSPVVARGRELFSTNHTRAAL